MGRAHRNKETFPRLADPLGYVDKDDILHAVKAIVATQRDYGRRDDRKQVRRWVPQLGTQVAVDVPRLAAASFLLMSYMSWACEAAGVSRNIAFRAVFPRNAAPRYATPGIPAPS